jgi:transcriptional regulator with XRE-family HTH domain
MKTTPTPRDQILAAMTARQMNPHSLAKAAGVAQPGLSKWLAGKQATITVATLERVAAALGKRVKVE